MGKIDLTNEEIRKEIYEKLKRFKYKSEAYRYFKIPDNQYGIEYLKKIAEKIGFDLNYYKEKREKDKIKNCLYCGKELKKQQKKFCCSSCSAKYNNTGKKHSEESKKKISESVHKHYQNVSKGEHLTITSKNKFVCLECGKEFESYQKNRIFCCGKCQAKYHNKTKIENWLNGEKYETERLPDFIRKFLHEKYDNKCQLCGWGEENPITHKIPLQIHHIDGDCTNNKEDNLQLLCPNCHSLTETFGSKNKGSKRYKLKEYKDGLSKTRILSMLKNMKDNDREEILQLLK